MLPLNRRCHSPDGQLAETFIVFIVGGERIREDWDRRGADAGMYTPCPATTSPPTVEEAGLG